MKYVYLTLISVVLALFVSCKEEIDMSDRYTLTDETIASYLQKHSQYSEYVRILGEVQVSERSKSSLIQLLTARGYYTVFAPDNKAIQNYLDTLVAHKIIAEPTWESARERGNIDSLYQVIVYNSIVDGCEAEKSYTTSSFPLPGDEFELPNMNDRKLSITYGVTTDSIFVNGLSLISLDNHDIPAINGYIHVVDHVIAPNDETLGDIFESILSDGKEGFLVMAKLLKTCDLLDTLSRIKDETYERMYKMALIDPELPIHPTENKKGYLPEHRKYGFTLFAEPDDFWRTAIGKEPKDITIEDIRQYIKTEGLCPDAVDDTNYKSIDNALNQFVTYHLLPMRIPKNKLVFHYNERGYTYGTTKSATIPVFEYYTTMGKRRLMKIYESAETNGTIYLNRFPKLNNARNGNYHESSCDVDKEGVALVIPEDMNEISYLNGIIYPIDRVLAYTNETRNNLQKERIRFDVASVFPEFMNNDIRGDRTGTDRTLRVGLPCNSVYPYLADAEIYDGSLFYYLSGFRMPWNNYQGDELNVIGKYEMTFRLPPVPRRGTYEIRYLVGAGSSYRGLCQVYFGTNPHNLPAMGIPLDLRMGGEYRYTPAGSFPSIVGWEADKAGDPDYNAEVDKKMRANGFMKAPASYICFSGGSDRIARNVSTSVRRIIVTQTLDPDKEYYIRFKNVLENDKLQFYMDYLEFCAKEVYDNPNDPEDIW